MIILRALGSVLLVIAAVALLRDLLNWYDGGTLALLPGDQLWLSLSPGGYQSALDWAGSHLPLPLRPVMANLLALPVVLSAGVLGAFLRIAFRRRHRDPRWGKSWRRMYG